jgi:hypothetical protein
MKLNETSFFNKNNQTYILYGFKEFLVSLLDFLKSIMRICLRPQEKKAPTNMLGLFSFQQIPVSTKSTKVKILLSFFC